MKIFFLLVGLATNDGGLELIKIPISYGIKQVTCDKALKSIDERPDSNFGMYYQNRLINVHWCEDKKGNHVE